MSDAYDREIDIRGIVLVGVGLTLLIAVSALAMWGLSAALRDRGAATDPAPPVLPEARRPVEIVGPRLQTDPVGDIEVLRAAEREVLEGWGWADEARGLARVPVDRAIDLYVDGARAAAPALPQPPPQVENAGAATEGGTP